MDQELNKKVITITSKEEKGGEYPMVTIKDQDEHKYTVFMKKKDGSSSKAYEQLQKIGIDTEVEVSFKAEDQEFTNKEGKEIKYVRRTVAFFAEAKEQVANSGQPVNNDVSERLNILENRVAKLENGTNSPVSPEKPSETPTEPVSTPERKEYDFNKTTFADEIKDEDIIPF